MRDATTATCTVLQTTVAVNGTVRMVPRDLKRYRSSHMPQKLRLALGLVLGCLTAFTLTPVTVAGGRVRLSVMSSRHSQGTTCFRRRCLRMPREIESMAITAGMAVLALSLRMGGVCVCRWTLAVPFPSTISASFRFGRCPYLLTSSVCYC